MKKSIFNLMTAAVALGTLASCSDDLIEKSGLTVKDGDLVAELPALTDATANTRVAKLDGGSFVWDSNDQIQVYKISSLTYSTYNLTGGEGTEIGVFEKQSGESQSGGNLYAVTQPKNSNTIYGISSDDNENAVLTATILNKYDWETVESNGQTAYKVPTPFWGKANISGNNISVAFNALTGFMKINLRDLPDETKSIVLTTHEDFSLDNDFTDAIPGVKYTEGKNQPLSGTLRATLKDETSKLEIDERLAKYDYIRVDLDNIETDAAGDYIIYIPVVAQHYEKLYVMAVTDFGRGSYDYEGQMLREYEDYNWEVGAVNGFSLTEVVDLNLAGATSFKTASEIIAKEMLSDGRHTLRVTMDPTGWADTKLYIGSNLETNGTSVEINFSTAVPAGFQIVECPVQMNSTAFGNFKEAQAMTAVKARELDPQTLKKQRVVRVNFQAANAADIILPTSYVELSSEVDQPNPINLFAAALKKDGSHEGVSGYAEGNLNKKDASIIIKGGVKADGTPVEYATVNVLENSYGDVYVTEADTYIGKLDFKGANSKKGSLRITDALIENINYEGFASTDEVSIFTTGAAAIGNSGITSDAGSVKVVKVYAYWTGKALSDNALDKGMDCGKIFTAAQLQGVGLAAGLKEGAGAFTFKSGNALASLTPKYAYTISDNVSSIWLGGEKYPWLGAQVGKLVGGNVGDQFTDRNLKEADPKLTSNVSIDGNNKELRNMKLDITDPYFVDPHVCCTTCGDYSVKVKKSLGLVRSIYTTGKVDVKKIFLDDVLLESTYKIDDIASIVGTIDADDNVTLADNVSTNVRINAVGDYIGGQYGNIFTQKKLAMTNLLVGQEVGESQVNKVYVTSKGDNVGGVAGIADAAQEVEVHKAIVHLNEVSAIDGSNVGGLIGINIFGANSFVESSEVKVNKIFATQMNSTKTADLQNTGNGVGGMIGSNMGNAGAFAFNFANTVVADEIIADNQNAGGLVGYSKLPETQDFKIANTAAQKETVKVNVKKVLKAHNGYVGGLIGYDSQSKETRIGYNLTDPTVSSDGIVVTLADIEGAFAVGGLVGSNTALERVYAGADRPIKVTINGVANTWNQSDFTSTSSYGYLNLTQSDRYKNCGSFGTLLGLKNDKLFVTGSGSITVAGSVVNNTDSKAIISSLSYAAKAGMVISNTNKKALFFQLHSDTGSALGVTDDKFWGDINGYIGFDKNGNTYSINGEVQGAQIKNIKIASY